MKGLKIDKSLGRGCERGRPVFRKTVIEVGAVPKDNEHLALLQGRVALDIFLKFEKGGFIGICRSEGGRAVEELPRGEEVKFFAKEELIHPVVAELCGAVEADLIAPFFQKS